MATETEAAPKKIRRATVRKSDLDRAIKAIIDAGLHVAGVRIGPDGTVSVLTGANPQDQRRDELDQWRARRDARKAAGIKPGQKMRS